MEKTKAKPVLTETGNSDAESTGLTNAAQIARKLNNEDKDCLLYTSDAADD